VRIARQGQEGETLVEILIAIVLIGAVFGAYFASYATAATGSRTQRDLVTADGILRNYAESIKQAVQDPANGCGNSNVSTFTAPYSVPPQFSSGFSVSSTPSVVGQSCPPKTSVQNEHLVVTLPDHSTRSLDISVRTP
jgi:type II secretory pathway pseudopilin PulG